MTMGKTLFWGNGINRVFEGDSWSRMLKEMATDPTFESDLPMPLQAVLATNNHVDKAVQRISSEMRGEISNDKQRAIIRRLLSGKFENIITTNYSYELEIASTEKKEISNYALDKMRCTTQKKARVESKYLIHTYNDVLFDNHYSRVWHIHGEARNPRGMVICYYYYGNLLARIKSYVDENKDRYLRDEKNVMESEIKSWIDAFILNDVYMLGFGFDFSEMDLWWLLERKNRERAAHGKVFYYCPEWEAHSGEKLRLLQSYGVEICGIDIKVNDKEYLDFYNQAISEIVKRK